MAERDPRTHAIIGAAMEVHREIGCGFLEQVYQKAFAIELAAMSIPHRREVEVPVVYKGQPLDVTYRMDFLCYGTVVVEVKALPKLTAVEEAQLLNYLKGSGKEVGLLLNFGSHSLGWKRMVLNRAGREQPEPSDDEAEESPENV